MNKFDKIIEIVKDYQKEANKIFSEYQKAEKKARERYQPEAFKTEFIAGQWPGYAGKARAMADIAIKEVDALFDSLRTELDQWATAKVEPGILETLRYVRDFGLRLSRYELQAVEPGIRDSYMGQKIFSAIARSSGFETSAVQMDELINSLTSARSATAYNIRCFAGSPADGFPGRDLIDHRFVDGNDWGEYSPIDMTNASLFPTKNGGIRTAQALWERSRAPMHYELTSQEADRLMGEIEKAADLSGHVSKDAADRLITAIPDILDRMDSLPDTDREDVKSLRRYYVLGSVGEGHTSDTTSNPLTKEQESILQQPSPALEVAKGYVMSHGPADKDILANF